MMDMNMLGTWHYEFWHLGIGLVIFFGGILVLIALIWWAPASRDDPPNKFHSDHR